MKKPTQETKLREIIEHALKNKWVFAGDKCANWRQELKGYLISSFHGIREIREEQLAYVIFDHGFCKAFFGEMKVDKCKWCKTSYTGNMSKYSGCVNCVFHKGWQYHGQQLFLVKESERINYLYKYLKNGK